MRTHDDAVLIDLARGGSAAALGELFERYWPLAWKAAYAVVGERAVADDAAQDALQRAFAALERFDESRPFWPWLKRITVNRALDEVRRRPIDLHTGAVEELELELDGVPEPVAEVAAAVALLPETKRTVVVLHYWLNYTVEEIAAALGVPFGTVASRLSRALGELRTKLEEEDVA